MPLYEEAGSIYGPLEQGGGLVNGVGATALTYNNRHHDKCRTVPAQL